MIINDSFFSEIGQNYSMHPLHILVVKIVSFEFKVDPTLKSMRSFCKTIKFLYLQANIKSCFKFFFNFVFSLQTTIASHRLGVRRTAAAVQDRFECCCCCRVTGRKYIKRKKQLCFWHSPSLTVWKTQSDSFLTSMHV